jgi:sugar/nucleoside kinase (ribokinase family)
MRREIDILSTGELLIDMITAEFVQSLEEASLFKRIPGGSAANLCSNMARLGNKALLSASVGNDDLGRYLKQYVTFLGVDTSGVSLLDDHATTLILVTRSAYTSDFVPYRAADNHLSIRQFPFGKFEQINIFHTTCFGLSKAPAQSVILEAAEKARRAGCRLSLDANYASKIWPDQNDAQKIIREYVRFGALIKISDVDWERLFGEKASSPDVVFDYFLRNNASEVCYTMGAEGCWVANDKERHFVPGRKVEVKDTTGAGDAFWAGYLTAVIDDKSLVERAMAGRKMAEIKIGHFGTLPTTVDRQSIYEETAES